MNVFFVLKDLINAFYLYILGVFIETYCSLHSNNNIESRDISDVKINMALYNLNGRHKQKNCV